MHRRGFLRAAAMGTAAVTMPAFLHACSVSRPAMLAERLPEDPFLDWFAIDRAVLGRLMAALYANGADAAELYFHHRRQSDLRLRGGAVGAASTDIVQGVGLRVVRGDAASFAFTEDLSEEGIEAAARRLGGAGGAAAPSGESFAAATPGELYKTELAWSDVGVDHKLPILETVDRLARAADPAVRDVEVSWSDIDERVLIATQDGRLVTDRRPMTRVSAQITIIRNGISHSAFASAAARDGLSWYTDERISALVDEAVSRTQVLFDARRPPIGDMPVMLAAGTSGVLLHEAVGHAFEADFVRDGSSPYGSVLNERIADASVTIVDQGNLPHARGSMNYDDEGLASRRNVLVEAGVLRTFLHDSTTARQFGTTSTASGRRESYRHEPMPRMSCTFMTDGSHSRDELIASMGRGLIAETYTGGDVSLGDGEFRFKVKNGWLVEKGKVLMPVRDFVLAGNGPDMLADIAMVADDSELDRGGWSCGKHGQTVPVSQGMPSVLVAKLTVEPPS